MRFERSEIGRLGRDEAEVRRMLRGDNQSELDIRKLHQSPCIVMIKNFALEVATVPVQGLSNVGYGYSDVIDSV